MSIKLVARVTHRPDDQLLLPWAVDVEEEGMGLVGFTTGLTRQSMVEFAGNCAAGYALAFGKCSLEIVGDLDLEDGAR